ncbi:MAG: hypothetical protein KME45_03045 [Stenomitos rutilans HA7619-LM2]|nr:hypothetical protein [Stenomitos rutilans HA7619-LM2]MBW4469361.1 hypothetical protein [Stenomitos rutilans HA7619-LM2]
MARTSITVPESLLERFRKYCDKQRRSVSSQIALLMEEVVDDTDAPVPGSFAQSTHVKSLEDADTDIVVTDVGHGNPGNFSKPRSEFSEPKIRDAGEEESNA